jgi:8-oxo-dGTP pyrophosphatase MutT (NUDIX family)
MAGCTWWNSSATRLACGAGRSRRARPAPNLADAAPDELAARELREETGLRAGKLRQIGLLDVAPGMSSQRGRVFLATELTDGHPERELEEQDMRSAWLPRDQVEAMISAGEITDAQSVAAYALLVLHERRTLT